MRDLFEAGSKLLGVSYLVNGLHVFVQLISVVRWARTAGPYDPTAFGSVKLLHCSP